VNLLHPRSTGLLFILRTLAPQIKTLRLLDITIGYPGVTRGGYAQEWYGLTSVFIKGIAPPTINIHLRMIDLHREAIPGVTDETGKHAPNNDAASDTTPLLDQQHQGERITAGPPHPSAVPGVASEEQARAFNVWLRRRWSDKEALLDRFTTTGGFAVPPRGEDGNVIEDEVAKRDLVQGRPVVIPIGLW
jgi:lysocardiolipin and lysophospholipid acyltransferase